MITGRATIVVVDAIIHVDSGGNIIRIEQRGRRYDIIDPINAGNVAAGQIHVYEDVVVSGPFWESS